MSLQLFRDPVFCVGDGITYEKEMIKEWFKNNNKSPKTGVELNPEQKVCLPNFAIRTACDAIRKEKEPENRSSDIPLVPSDEVINQLNDKIAELKDEIDYLENREPEYNHISDEAYVDLCNFWKAFSDYFDTRGTAPEIYEQLRLFQHEVANHNDNFSWGMEDMEQTEYHRCFYSGRKIPTTAFGGPVGISETLRRTGVNDRRTWIWNLWFENQEARDAYHAELPNDHPLICGDITESNRRLYLDRAGEIQFIFPKLNPDTWEVNTPEPPDISRIRLEDLGGRR